MSHPKESVSQSKSYQYALYYMSRYPKTRKELEMKLLQKWFSYEAVTETIDALESQNIVNDAKFAEGYVYSECVKKGKPIINIRNKLYQKWISREIIDSIMQESSEGMEQWISEKIIKEIEQYKRRGIEWLEIISKLMRKGYTADQIKDAVALRDGKR